MKHLLIIEDSDADIFITKKLLEINGFFPEITVVRSAAEGLHYLNTVASFPDSYPNLILLDLFLPQADGFTFLDKFDEKLFINSSIVIVTVADDSKLRERAFSYACVDGFISKPLSETTLNMLCKMVLENS